MLAILLYSDSVISHFPKSDDNTKIYNIRPGEGDCMIRPCGDNEFPLILEIINDSATAYRGIIPDDRWHDPYMSLEELQKQIGEGVEFWCSDENGFIRGVMGIQDRGEVTLIRHAYVRTALRNGGVGGELLIHLRDLTEKPVLIGTWVSAGWAVRFYKKHGFQLVPEGVKDKLLMRYWNVPLRQIETSVVLADEKWYRRYGEEV